MQHIRPFQLARRAMIGMMAASALSPLHGFAKTGSSAEALRALLERHGIEVAYDGMEISL